MPCDSLQAYFLTGKDLKVKKIKEEPRGVLAELIVATDNLAPGMPYIVRLGRRRWQDGLAGGAVHNRVDSRRRSPALEAVLSQAPASR